MRIIDSNLIIYSALPEFSYLRPLMKADDTYASAVSRLEVLGYQKLDDKSKKYFERLFEWIPILPITDFVLDSAISLKQQKKMSIGDAIIAATALLHDLELNTRNTLDFDWITGLKIYNPIT